MLHYEDPQPYTGPFRWLIDYLGYTPGEPPAIYFILLAIPTLIVCAILSYFLSSKTNSTWVILTVMLAPPLACLALGVYTLFGSTNLTVANVRSDDSQYVLTVSAAKKAIAQKYQVEDVRYTDEVANDDSPVRNTNSYDGDDDSTQDAFGYFSMTSTTEPKHYYDKCKIVLVGDVKDKAQDFYISCGKSDTKAVAPELKNGDD